MTPQMQPSQFPQSQCSLQPAASLATQPATSTLTGSIKDIPGILACMLIAFDSNGIHTVEDLAACATDDLLGWTERKGDKMILHPGILGDMPVSRKECDAIILRARVRMGWIAAEALDA
jgi:N utilization substance protein A